MGKPGGAFDIRSDADASASESLARLSDRARAENIAAAAVVHEMHELYEIRLAAEMDVHLLGADHPDCEPDVGLARHTSECEAAVALSLSRTVAREKMTVANHLAWRLADVDSAFTAGDLDYARVRTIVLTLIRASDSTVAALQPDVLAAALRCNTRALREKIWKSWIEHDPNEAAAAQKAAVSEERCAEIRRGDDGIATLIAKMSLLEGAECDALLEEFAATVCSRDPRTKKQLRGHALIALLHREQSLLCMCGMDLCPMAVAAEFVPQRRKPLINIHVDIETLLRLHDGSATLSDGTVIDPDTARLVATDARWQGLLTEMFDAAQSHRPDLQDGHADTNTFDRPHDPTASQSNPARRRRARARRVLARGRTRPAAALPDRTNGVQRRTAYRGSEAALSKAIADFLAAAAEDTTLADGRHPDGHGGHATPPPGALTYRPSAELVALVRATYRTCTFPGCSVPAPRCDIDHIVPFDHDDPAAGGWTILANLHPLCAYHHHAKTLRLWACAKLDGDGIYWRSGAGLHRISPSDVGTVTVPDDFVHRRPFRPTVSATRATESGAGTHGGSGARSDATPRTAAGTAAETDVGFVYETDPETDPGAQDGPGKGTCPVTDQPDPPEEIYEPTWWETYMTDCDNHWYKVLNFDTFGGAPTLADIARLDDPQSRADAEFLRAKFLEHRAVIAQREKYRPPPF